VSVGPDEELEALRQSIADEEHERLMVERYDEPYWYWTSFSWDHFR
jgi:hypothetical protein